MYTGILSLTTRGQDEILNITHEVQELVRKSGVKEGLCLVQSLHTTAGIFVNVTEHLDGDILALLQTLAPERKNYRHNAIDPNAQAHLKKLLTGRTATIPIVDGELLLGTWEKIQFAEFDGPRSRQVHVTIR